MATTSSFSFLSEIDPNARAVAAQAEALLHVDPPACIQKLRMLAEFLAQHLCAVTGAGTYVRDQHDRITALKSEGVLEKPEADLFHEVRTAGNAAAHNNKGTARDAQHLLRICWNLAVFTRRAAVAGPFSPPPFALPVDPSTQQREVLARLAEAERRADALAANAQRALADADSRGGALDSARAELEALRQQLAAVSGDRDVWEELATELQQRHLDALADLRARVDATPGAREAARANAAAAAYTLTEVEVRARVDADLTRAGWTADSEALRWSKGVRPQAGARQAIAEVPTADGVADYVLFDGLDAMAVVEAKATHVDVPGVLAQARRYARAFIHGSDATAPGGPWGEMRVPFAFATNGRGYFAQLKEKSGVWFDDLHRPLEPPRPLAGWYTPEGLRRLLGVDVDASRAALDAEPMDYLGLRPYQREAIRAVEGALTKGERRALLAMATGTGKTRTCLGLVYRLLKAKRFRRVLFLVDREALAEQAWEQFSKEKLEQGKSLTEIYDSRGLGTKDVDSETRLHVSTVQGLIRRILFAKSSNDVPPIDQYDCVVVDECHRGYVLDAEMTDVEMLYRSDDDYVSKYRRALEHFDAVRIGLTATPAQHTVQIFGMPVYQYRFRDAVLDGFLVDQEPVIRIRTRLATQGVTYEAETEVLRWNAARSTVEFDTLPDAVSFDVGDFNSRVLVKGFNATVCDELVRQIDPDAPGKTLIFCANDAHADMVVELLRESLASLRGLRDPGLVAKITGSVDQPLRAIRHFRLERLPDIAVTVDLLTTGVDVPSITALVFLRPVKSRILYEQMIGRGTRLCPGIGKTSFKVFDAVGVTESLHSVSQMNPVAVDPSFSFGRLTAELRDAQSDIVRDDLLDQLLAKLRVALQRSNPASIEAFTRAAGAEPADALASLREGDPAEHARWWAEREALARWLDTPRARPQWPIISEHDDEVLSVEQSVGDAPPEEYLDGFGRFIAENLNLVPALAVVVQRPRDLTRATLKEVRVVLEENGFREPSLQAAWKLTRNADIAAGIIGHIRQRALGSPLMAYELRVEAALSKMLASREWSDEQRRWLQRIAQQMKQEVVVDRSSLDAGAFATIGGARRADAVFDGQTDAVLGDFIDAAWQDAG